MTTLIEKPFPVFFDRYGNPLDSGFVYIGQYNMNPQTDPIEVFWDEALTQPAVQPIRTINGYYSQNGSPAKLYISGSACSITVLDKNKLLVFSDLKSNGERTSNFGFSLWRPISGGYAKNARVTLENGDIVKSTVDGNVNDPNVDMTGWVNSNSASQIIDSGGKTQQEVNDFDLYVTKNERMFGVTGVGDETSKLQTALQQKNINLVSDQVNINARITVTSKNIKGNGTVINSTGSIIPMLTQDNDNFKLKNVKFNANNGGQLSAGLVTINSCKGYLVEDVELINGGTVGANGSDGVNAIGVATNGYPVGGKSSGDINRVVTRNFTKAPINFTTYSEESTLTFSKFYDCVGNGFTPAIQINGGIRTKSIGNHVFRTEGAGTAIATVGNVPPIAAQDILSAFNTYYDIGSLGVSNAERHAINIADATAGENPIKDIFIHGDALYGAVAGFVNASYAQNINSYNGYSDNTFGVYRLNNTNGVNIFNHVANRFLSKATNFSAYYLNNSSNVNVFGGVISASVNTSNAYLLSGAGLNSNVTINDVIIKDKGIGIMPTNSLSFFRNTHIKVTRFITMDASEIVNIFAGIIADGRTINAKISASCIGGNTTTYSDQIHECMYIGVSGVATSIASAFTKDFKSSVSGLLFDVTSSNLVRYRLQNNTANPLVFKVNIDVYLN